MGTVDWIRPRERRRTWASKLTLKASSSASEASARRLNTSQATTPITRFVGEPEQQ
jgi:hypothetical protein